MGRSPRWFLQLLRWYVLLPLTMLVVTLAPHLPGAGLADSDSLWQEGVALLFTVLAHIVLFAFADGAERSAISPEKSHLPWQWLLAAVSTAIVFLGIGAWATSAPPTAAPPPGLAGTLIWFRAMVLAGMVSPAVDLEGLARRALERKAPAIGSV